MLGVCPKSGRGRGAMTDMSSEEMIRILRKLGPPTEMQFNIAVRLNNLTSDTKEFFDWFVKFLKDYMAESKRLVEQYEANPGDLFSALKLMDLLMNHEEVFAELRRTMDKVKAADR
jgi:hypothetical protein